MTKTKLVSKQRFLQLNFKVRSYFGISVKLESTLKASKPSLEGPGTQELLQICFWGWVDRFRHLGNSILRFSRRVTIILAQVTKVKTGGCYLGICLHLHKILLNTKVILTLLPEQLQRPASTLWKALDLPNSLVAIPGSLADPYIPKKAKNGPRS